MPVPELVIIISSVVFLAVVSVVISTSIGDIGTFDFFNDELVELGSSVSCSISVVVEISPEVSSEVSCAEYSANFGNGIFLVEIFRSVTSVS